MLKKLFTKHGETLTEALVSILIIALSAALLATMISAAVNINIRANAATASLYEQLTAAETGGNPKSDTVTINGATVYVKYYGEADALTAYVKAGGTP